MSHRFLTAVLLLIFSHASLTAAKELKAGAAIIDISPTNYPVVVNAMFTERTATKTVDPLTARALVLDNGETTLVMVIVDTCMMPRDLIDRAKEIAAKTTGLPTSQMMVSATHTHSAPAAMGCLGSRVDPAYAAILPGRIAEAILQAHRRLEPARIGWGVMDDWDHTFNRRWIRRPDRIFDDPFGDKTVRAHMHPGHQSPDVTGPSGPVDPALSVIAIENMDRKPLALLANYSMHYYESELLSSDYFGKFAHHIGSMLGAPTNFVGMMSQGTSGDLMWMDYGAPRKQIGYDAYAREIATNVHKVYQRLQFTNWVPLKIAQTTLPLNYRVPSEPRLSWAREMSAKLNGRLPQQLPEIYALEAIHLHENPKTEIILQALRIGDLGITALPNEVYALTGLKLKAQSPLQPCINIELANGAEGYIPPPEQHKLGGYTTWPARTAGLEVGAEPMIVEKLLTLLEEVAGQPRRQLDPAPGPYTRAVLDSRPTAYWRLEELVTPRTHDATPHKNHATFENGVALYLPGPGSGSGISPNPQLTSSPFAAEGSINRAAHFAGGRLSARLETLPATYSIEFWFWNGLPNDVRPVTGYLFSRGPNHDPDANGDHLGIGGTHQPEHTGKLLFYNGNTLNELIVGQQIIQPKIWHHVALVREGARVTVYLDGQLEFSGQATVATSAPSPELFIGGRNDNFANFEGKIDEVAVYDHALSKTQIQKHFDADR